MDEQMKKLLKSIEQSTHVSIDEIMRIAQAVQYSDFTDEATVRQLVQQLTHVANRRISDEKEEQIVQSILRGSMPRSIEELQRYFR